jgi:hypothetical protein
MIAVAGDPLANIRVLEQVQGVIKGGVMVKAVPARWKSFGTATAFQCPKCDETYIPFSRVQHHPI